MRLNQVFFAVFTLTGTRRQTTASPFLFLQRQISVNFVGKGLAQCIRGKPCPVGRSILTNRRAGCGEGGAMQKRILPIIALSMALNHSGMLQSERNHDHHHFGGGAICSHDDDYDLDHYHQQ